MKIYQCIHKYPLHIPYLEKKYNIQNKELSFDELRDIVLQDGYASAYILKPALEGKSEEVFYTIWNYERLQYKWAEENGLKSRNLDEIKLAQIENFNPDVFYNHSPRYDRDFIKKLNGFTKLKKICWDAIITEYPWLHEKYDLRLTLFEPYVRYWKSKDFFSSLLTPAFSPTWAKYNSNYREIDVLFYGQILPEFFSGRNTLLMELLEWNTDKNYKIHVHLQNVNRKLPLINLKGLRRITKWRYIAPRLLRINSLPPVYGGALYESIGNAKIVINAFGDKNGLFKDNMRNYEAIGCGALMIAQDGIFPAAFEPDKDFLTFRNTIELFEKIEYVLSLPDNGRPMAERAQNKLLKTCSKEVQWNAFRQLISSIR